MAREIRINTILFPDDRINNNLLNTFWDWHCSKHFCGNYHLIFKATIITVFNWQIWRLLVALGHVPSQWQRERYAQSCPLNHYAIFPSVLNLILLYPSQSSLIILVKKKMVFKFSSLAVTHWPALRFLTGWPSLHITNITEDITRYLDTFSSLCNLTNGLASDFKWKVVVLLLMGRHFPSSVQLLNSAH